MNAFAPLDTPPSSTDLPVTAGQSWRFGRYQVLEEISRGGAGVVFRARDEALRRDVALKFLHAGRLASRDDIRRLFLEARAAARLNHPSIVPVFEIGGADDAQPFLAMAFLPGGTLAARLKQGAVSPSDAARWLSAVALAVHHAHQHGILHRDLKPGSILFDAAGAPLVADFGLARLLDEDQTLTRTDAILGTPAYLAPEQAAGRAGEITTAADIHALGAILYETLTGRPPFAGDNLPALLRQVAEAPAVPPRQIDSAIPRDLETICLKCLEKDPAKRYAPAQELAEELDRFLKDEPIHARPITRAERGWRWCRRKPALAASLVLVLVLLLILGIGGPLTALRINQARQAETIERQRAEAEAHRARLSAYASDMLLAHQALEKNNRGHVRDLLEKHRPTGKSEIRNPKSEDLSLGTPSTINFQPSTDLRSWEWRYLWSQTLSDELFTLVGYSNTASVTAWAPDGQRLATAGRSASSNNSVDVSVWHVSERRELRTLGYPGSVMKLHFVGNDQLLVVGQHELTIRVWNSLTGRTVEFPTGGDSLFAVCLSADGNTLGAAGKTWVRLWNVKTEVEIARLAPGGDMGASERAIAVSADGKRFAYYKSKGPTDESSISIVLWDVAKSSLIDELKGHTDRVYNLAFSPDGRLLASGSLDKTAKLWDLQTRQVRSNLSGHTAPITTLAFSPNGKLLATGSWDQQIRLWDTASGEQLGRLQGHTKAITSIAFSPDGEQISSTSRDGTVRVWKAAVSLKPPSFRPNIPLVFSTQFSPAADSFWTFDGEATVKFWNPTNLTETSAYRYPGEEKIGTGPGSLLAFQQRNNHVAIYSASPLRKLNELRDSTNTVRALVFSRDGKLLAVPRDDWPGNAIHTVGVWDWAAEKEITRLQVRPQWVSGMGFSRANELISRWLRGSLAHP